jgi:hypothetical protein
MQGHLFSQARPAAEIFEIFLSGERAMPAA